jgi:sporulation protein YlmC with PRC-barrel domain
LFFIKPYKKLEINNAMHVRELESKEVISKDGAVVGKTTNAIIDTSQWRVISLEVNLDDKIAEDLEMKKMFRSTTLPIPIDQVDAVGDTILLKTRKEEIPSVLLGTRQQMESRV